MARHDPPADTAAAGDVARAATDGDLETADELPIVARLAIEIRSDGTRTLARGALHDVASGQQVAIELGDASIAELTRQLGAAGLSGLSALRGLPRMLSKSVGGMLARAIGRAIPLRLPARLRRRRDASQP